MPVAWKAFALAALAVGGLGAAPVAAQPGPKEAPKAATSDSPAATLTRTKLLKAKVTLSVKEAPLREVLKECAAQVDMQAERPVLWTYAAGVPAGKAVTYNCKDKSLEQVLDELFGRLGLGYVVLSMDDQPRDGWVQITQGAERGYPKGATPATADEDEKDAAGRLTLAKDLIDKGKAVDAKLVLKLVVKKFPGTKAAAEANALLEKLNK